MTVENLSQALGSALSTHPTSQEPSQTESGRQMLRLLASIDRQQLASLMTTQRFKPGEVIFREGDDGDAAYLIWSGRVAIVKGDLRSPTILGRRGPGEFIGEMALLDGRPRSASAVGIDELRLLRIGRRSFQQLLGDNPAVGVMIMESLSARLRDSDESRSGRKVVEKQLSQQVSALRTEKEQLEQLERFRQETIDLIVHDLRNPLGIIRAALQMLEMTLPEEILQANQDLLTVALSASGRMQRLVDSILDVAKLESDDPQLNLIEADLSPVLKQASTRQSFAMNQKQISCQVHIADTLLVAADIEKIERVLINLIDNATKFTPSGGVVTVEAKTENDQVVVSVTDTGPGIPPLERERIFDRFAQVAGSESAAGRRGFGLGLSFCQLAVEAHGGRIWVEPGPNDTGSRFVFTLPQRVTQIPGRANS